MIDGLKSAKRKAMGTVDRIVTILVTATITSMVWIVAGGSLIEMSGADSQRDKTRPGASASEAARPLTQETVAAEEGDEERPGEADAPGTPRLRGVVT